MITELERTSLLNSHLFGGKTATVFVIVDGASVSDLPARLRRHKPEYDCLYPGALGPEMAEVAPYLAILKPDTFTEWLLSRGWGKHWGIFGTADTDFPTLMAHFRSLLTVRDEARGKSVYFRYYDPRVMRAFLPICDGDQLQSLFGPVASYIVEDRDPNIVRRFSIDQDRLRVESLEIG